MITIQFTLYGLIFIIIAALAVAALVTLILDACDILWLDEFWGTLCGVIVVIGFIAIIIMGTVSSKTYTAYTETEYDIEQMITDAKTEDYEITTKFMDIREPTLRIYTSLITNKKKYKYYIPKKQENEKYRREVNEQKD